MAVYVDPLRVWGGASAPRCFRFKPSCHMFADTLEELHAMAKKIGMQRSWFQDAALKHYDLTEGKRWQAIRYGAQEATFEQMVDYMRRRNVAGEKRDGGSAGKVQKGKGTAERNSESSEPLRRRRSP